MIDEKDKVELLSIFETLLSINSPSGSEKAISDKIIDIVKELPLEIITNASINNTKPNLIFKLPAYNSNNPESILFSAHMDTVEPTEGIKIIKDSSIYKTNGSTILGADDKSGIAAILETLFVLTRNNIPHPKIEVCLTVEEEIGLKGANALDFSLLESKIGLILDCDGDVGRVINAAPSQINFKVTIQGKAAHAGVEPENGKNAILFAGKAISSLRLGRIDPYTTTNIGTIHGGKATNIVPELVELTGEIRSHNENILNSLYEKFMKTFKDGEKEGFIIEFSSDKTYSNFRIDENDPLISLLKYTAEDLDIPFKCMSSGGGSDANIFNKNGTIKCVVLSTGMEKVHTHEEYIKIDNLVALTNWLVQIAYKSA